MILRLLKISAVILCILFLNSFSYYEPVEDTIDTSIPQLPQAMEFIKVDFYDSRVPQLPEPMINSQILYTKYNITPIITKPIITKPTKPVPEWILKGILMRESSSYYRADGTIRYVNRKTLSAGAIGPFQMKDIAFDDVKEPGEDFNKLKKNMKFAEQKACDYLLFLYKNFAHYNWDKAIMMYNQGIKGYRTNKQDAIDYLNYVKKYGKNSDK